MTLILSNEYPGRANAPTAEYPQGSIKNRTAPGDLDGTPVDQDWLNDYVGFTAALLADAGVSASQAPDTALSSDRMRAISAAIFLRTIGALYGTGVKTYAAGVVVNTTTQRIIYRANRLYRYTGGAGVSFTCTGTWATDSAQFVIFEFTEITLKAASTSTAGTSKLNDTLISTSTTEALTANQGKVLKTAVDTAQSTANTGVSDAATAQSTADTALANAATAQSGVNALSSSKLNVDLSNADKETLQQLLGIYCIETDASGTGVVRSNFDFVGVGRTPGYSNGVFRVTHNLGSCVPSVSLKNTNATAQIIIKILAHTTTYTDVAMVSTGGSLADNGFTINYTKVF